MYNGLDIFENGIEPDYKCSNSAAESTILVEQETSRYSTTPTIGQEMVIDTNYSDIYSNMAGSHKALLLSPAITASKPLME